MGPIAARGWLGTERLLLAATVVIVGYLAVTPVAFLLYGSVQPDFLMRKGGFTLAHYAHAYTDREFYRLLMNSVGYAVGVCVLTFVLGAALAWICERTNTPGRRFFAPLAVMTYIIPGVLTTIAWILLLSPRIGLINTLLVQLFGLAEPPLSIYNRWGMIWAASIHLYPLSFLLMSAAFRSLDPALEEAAWTSGAGPLTCLRRVTASLMRPAILSSLLILFIRGIESFEVPALIGIPAGIPVFTTKIYEATHQFPPALGLAGATASILLAISVAGAYLYQRLTGEQEKFATITGRAYRPRPIDLGRWKYVASAACTLFFLVTLVLPLLSLVFISFSPYMTALSLDALRHWSLSEYRFVLGYPIIARAFRNSLFLAVASATLVMLLTSVIAWITVRSRARGRWILDALTFVPIAVPGVIMGVSLIFVYLTLPIPIYGTLWILLVAYLTLYLPYGIRFASASMIQIHRELEEASVVSGASWLQAFGRIVLPLLLPGFLAGASYIAIISFRELSASIFLVGQGTEVLSTVVFALWDAGNTTAVAALGVLMTLFLVVAVFAVQAWQRSLGILRAASR
ncbi:MAG TPA: iron ABC transporter permease [Thermodesulfobacteriota bacterium]|nr:iron ABC transporter permease [Thermodesulfobacteriota bacterium]